MNKITHDFEKQFHDHIESELNRNNISKKINIFDDDVFNYQKNYKKMMKKHNLEIKYDHNVLNKIHEILVDILKKYEIKIYFPEICFISNDFDKNNLVFTLFTNTNINVRIDIEPMFIISSVPEIEVTFICDNMEFGFCFDYDNNDKIPFGSEFETNVKKNFSKVVKFDNSEIYVDYLKYCTPEEQNYVLQGQTIKYNLLTDAFKNITNNNNVLRNIIKNKSFTNKIMRNNIYEIQHQLIDIHQKNTFLEKQIITKCDEIKSLNDKFKNIVNYTNIDNDRCNKIIIETHESYEYRLSLMLFFSFVVNIWFIFHKLKIFYVF
jgi:hypothetical protein